MKVKVKLKFNESESEMQVVFKKKLGILVMVGVQGLERANYGNLTN